MAQKDNVLQPEGDVTATEGEAVTLGCQYNSSLSNEYLYWYKQDGNNSPKFILSRFKFGEGKTMKEFEERFSSTLDSTLRSVPLKIQKLQLTDSAVYYCALRPTVTGNTTTLYKNLLREDNTPQHPLEGVTVQTYFSKSDRNIKTLSILTFQGGAQFRVKMSLFSWYDIPTNCLFNNSAACHGVFDDTWMIASSTYNWQQTSSQLSGNWLMYRQKSSGPRMEPCGTPTLQC
uniref:Ig-like domain-containing protein n=1 Tax=Labrus bergylta TaxID=56723 RepID=A0A3Q3FE48_9LABR